MISKGKEMATDIANSEINTILASAQAMQTSVQTAMQALSIVKQSLEQAGTGVTTAATSLGEVFHAANQITQIALQTRLVAFNASVEAKRAGEAGRGFTVVADAVKDLSERVESSSKQIVRTVQALAERIDRLSQDLTNQANADSTTQMSSQAAFCRLEQQLSSILANTQDTYSQCQRLRAEASTMSANEATETVSAIVEVTSGLRHEATQAQQFCHDAQSALERVGLGVREAAKSLAEVSDAASEITQIALQNRLVAFNASVEAQRAGRAGQGFSVVAKAVRGLSEKVETTSKQIMVTVQSLAESIDRLSAGLTGSKDKRHAAPTSFSTIEKSALQVASHAGELLHHAEPLLHQEEVTH
jgi:methyl-accepting chemotaxis protein